MKQFLALVLVLSMFSAATIGCAEKSTTTKETEVSTPGESTTVISQQQSGSDARQQGVFKGQQHNGANGPQQERRKDQKQSLSDGQHQRESKDQKQSGANVQQQGAAQNQQPDDSTKKEKKDQPNKESGVAK